MNAVAIVADDEQLNDDVAAAIATQRRRIRSLYRAARRATDLARVYVEETGGDHRVAAILLEVRAYRLTIRSIRRSL